MTLAHHQVERLTARVDPDGTLVREAVERDFADELTGAPSASTSRSA